MSNIERTRGTEAEEGPPSSGGGTEAFLSLDGFSLTNDFESGSDAPTSKPDAPPVAPQLVGELFGAFDKAVRARRLYQPNNPVYQQFIAGLRKAFSTVLNQVTSLVVGVEEGAFHWYGHRFETGEGRDNLSFLFYKDGIRHVTFLPGIEEEIERFLGVVHRARLADQVSDDDMVTLLWEEELACFQYSYVDALAEGVQLPKEADLAEATTGIDERPRTVDMGIVATEVEVGEPTERTPPSMQAGQPSVASSITRDDFVETFYFLDDAELTKLRAEVELEWARDIKRDVLNALFDRLEDPDSSWQNEILRILRQLLPAFLSRGDLASAAHVLVELNTILRTSDLDEAVRTEAERLFAELSEPAVLSQLLRSLEDGSIDPSGSELGVFLSHLNPTALPLLLRTVETTTVPSLQERLQVAVEALAADHKQDLIGLVGADETAVACGATRIAGKLGLTEAVPGIAALLKRSDTAVRRLAVEALVQIRSGASLDAVQLALQDTDREVRMAAARGLGSLRYQPARKNLEAAITGKLVRDADLTEQIAFFEAYGAVADQDSVDLLDKILNGRRMFARQSQEMRACSAMALGLINTQAARTVLQRAAADQQPMVRSAVAKALRQGTDA